MIRYQLACTAQDLQQVLALQQQNLPEAVPAEALASQGFVTVAHPLPLLQQMNAAAPAILAKKEEQVVGYCLAMTRAFRNDIPVLIPMFEVIDSLHLNGQSLREVDYLVCGQICVAEGYRGQGIFDGLYQQLRRQYAPHYPLLITEIATRNLRSLRAHQRLGFNSLHTYQAPDGEVWELVGWPWQTAKLP